MAKTVTETAKKMRRKKMNVKACPFCGNDNGLIECSNGRHGHFIYVKCDVCGARSAAVPVRTCMGDCWKSAEGVNIDACPFARHAVDTAVNKWNRRIYENEQ